MKTVIKYHPGVIKCGKFLETESCRKQNVTDSFISFSVIQESKAKPLMMCLKGNGIELMVPNLAAMHLRHQRFNLLHDSLREAVLS